jgi:peptidoglycan/xylan/chitin deacetylase (PgdA/CDA1 family)
MLKRALMRTITSTAGRLTARHGTSRAVVLCYHSIHPRLPFASANPDLFRDHLEWFGSHCEVTSLENVLEVARQRMDGCPRRAVVAITFDDGYEDNFTYAYPQLAKAGMVATFFVTVGLVQRDPEVMQRLKDLQGVDEDSLRAMSWEQVQQLAADGFTVGSHTYGHPNLARLERSQARAEIERAKAILEDQLGTPVCHFAYPFGRPRRHFTAQTVELVRAAGHTIATSILYRGVKATDDTLSIPRFFVSGDDLETLKAKVDGYWDPFGLWQEHGSRGLIPFQIDSSGRHYP